MAQIANFTKSFRRTLMARSNFFSLSLFHFPFSNLSPLSPLSSLSLSLSSLSLSLSLSPKKNRIAQYKIGDAITTSFSYDVMGRLLSIQSVNPSGTWLQNLSYTWDVASNLLTRIDYLKGVCFFLLFFAFFCFFFDFFLIFLFFLFVVFF